MTPEQERLLQETAHLARENNKILRKMQRVLFWKTVMHGVYWFVILGVAVGTLYFLQPYVDKITDAYQKIFHIFDTLGV